MLAKRQLATLQHLVLRGVRCPWCKTGRSLSLHGPDVPWWTREGSEPMKCAPCWWFRCASCSSDGTAEFLYQVLSGERPGPREVARDVPPAREPPLPERPDPAAGPGGKEPQWGEAEDEDFDRES